MGIRSVVRRGVTLASAGGDHIMGEAMDFPFNIKEVNIVAHSAQQVATREPIDIFGQRILEGVEQLATLSNYLDLPAFDAVRNLPLDPKRRRARGYKEAVLVLCSFSEKYQANNWRRHLRRFLTVYIPRDEDRDRDPEVLRTLDMKSPRLVSQSLYEAIRQLEMCVVDWTEWRPNVFFELGVRLATNRIGPVCVIDDAWRRRPEVPRAGARARRARGGAKGQPGDEELRLAGAAGQCARLFELFDPIVYRCPEGDVEGDAEAFERMTSRHEHYVGGGGAESTSALAPAFTYEVITRHIDWRVEAATKPVHRELADAANMISSPDVDSQGESTILYPRNPELAEKTEVGALERRLAAWYYLDNRHGWDKILNDADLSAHYEALGERLITQLLRSPSEENQELGDRIDERMGEYRKFKKAKE
jgi:hypothetical protein